jgi:sulfur-oxidizing protein SoxZ
VYTTRISVPDSAHAGEVIEVKTLIAHPMETGFRRDALGDVVPRKILRAFICRYDGREVFRAEFFPAIAANPFLAFHVRATKSGTLEFEWQDQDGSLTQASARLMVEP